MFSPKRATVQQWRPSIVPVYTYAPANNTGTTSIATAGTSPPYTMPRWLFPSAASDSTLVIPVCGKRFHRHYVTRQPALLLSRHCSGTDYLLFPYLVARV